MNFEHGDGPSFQDEELGLGWYLTPGEPMHHLFEEGTRAWAYYRGMHTPLFRGCDACDLIVHRDRPDPCLGYLPGVAFACCGHGIGRGYVCFQNGVTIRFPFASIDGVTNSLAGPDETVRKWASLAEAGVSAPSVLVRRPDPSPTACLRDPLYMEKSIEVQGDARPLRPFAPPSGSPSAPPR